MFGTIRLTDLAKPPFLAQTVLSPLFPSFFPPKACEYHWAASRKVAVVLSGCGAHDGSDVQETVSFLIHLARLGVEASCFAPDIPQSDVIDHRSGKVVAEEQRNSLREAARITRGKIAPLAMLEAASFDALFIPGGLGVVKTLSNFALYGPEMVVYHSLQIALKEFHRLGKPIGVTNMAPVLVVKAIQSVQVTVGEDKNESGRWPYAKTASAISEMGGVHVVRGPLDIHVDESNKIVSTATNMYSQANMYDVHEVIGKLVEHTLLLSKAM